MKKQAITITISEETISKINDYKNRHSKNLSNSVEELILEGFWMLEKESSLKVEVGRMVQSVKGVIKRLQENGLL